MSVNKLNKCIIWQRQYEHSDWLMGSHASRVLTSSPVCRSDTYYFCPPLTSS